MRIRSLVRAGILATLMAGATTVIVITNPPRSARQEAFNRWLSQMSDTEHQQLTFTFREDEGKGFSKEFVLSGATEPHRILRLVELAQEAELFRSEPLEEATATPEDPVTEIVVAGADKQFLFRDHRSRLAQSIAARSLRKLAELFASQEKPTGVLPR